MNPFASSVPSEFDPSASGPSESDPSAFDPYGVPPHAPQAEAAVLGSLILRPSGLRSAGLEPSDFSGERNRCVYLALCRLAAGGTAIDAVTLAEELQRSGRLDDAGGVGHLAELMAAVPHAEYLDHYAGQVREASARRRVIGRARDAVRLASSGGDLSAVAAALDDARAASAGAGPAGGSAVVRTLSEVPAERLEWLWPGRLPLGKLALLAGDPGLGKSFLTLDAAARVSTGRGWPDGEPAASGPGDVILFGAEDDLADTVRPRLEAAGADLARVAAVEGVRGPTGPRGFSLSTDLPRLEAVLAARPEARLVVVDPISAYCGGVDSHKNADVRALLAPLAALAARRRVALLAVTHLNKAAGDKAIYRSMGSLAYVAAARVGWLVAKDPGDPDRRLLLPIKNNLAADPGGLAYRIADGRLAWDADRIDLDPDTALGGRRGAAAGPEGPPQPGSPQPGPPARRHRADEWLEDRLAAGPVEAADVLADGVGAGLTDKMLREARRRLGVRSERRGTAWVLRLDPDRPAGRDLAAADDLAGLFGDPFGRR